MPQIINYTNCPVCNSDAIKQALIVKDYTVSKAVFPIWQCADCTLRFTQDVPSEDSISAYYQSADYISHSNTNKGLTNKLYHLIRAFTLNSKKNLIEKYTGKQSGILLDIGAGTGAFASTMQKAKWSVTALEPDEIARANAKKDFTIELQPSENLFTLKKNSFDAITLWHVLEHVHELHNYIQTFFSLLKDDGILVIAVPNYKSYDAAEYAEVWAAYDVPRHLYHFSPQSMKVLLQKHNFKLKKIKPMWFDSYYVSLLSEQYLTGKANLVKAFISGTVSNLKAIKNKQSSSLIYVAVK